MTFVLHVEDVFYCLWQIDLIQGEAFMTGSWIANQAGLPRLFLDEGGHNIELMIGMQFDDRIWGGFAQLPCSW